MRWRIPYIKGMTGRTLVVTCGLLAGVTSATAMAQSCGPSANDCCDPSPNNTPYCNDTQCCTIVCGMDPFCCNMYWDVFCAFQAYSNCACGPEPECGIGNNDCCVASATGTPYCKLQQCCNSVCEIDPSCCSSNWDATCAKVAHDRCVECGAEPACGVSLQDCCDETIPDGKPYCADEECCELICATDPSCCTIQWDFACAYRARYQCRGCDEPCVGDFSLDNQVNGVDLGKLLSFWGGPSDGYTDLNNDGVVNGADLGMLLGQWGPCP